MNNVVSWVWERFHGTPQEKLVMLAIASRCNKHGNWNVPYSGIEVEQDMRSECGFNVGLIIERLIAADVLAYRDSAYHLEAYKRDVLETKLAWYQLRDAVQAYLETGNDDRLREVFEGVKGL